MNNRRIYIIRYLSFAAALGVMIFIFLMSAQDAAASSGISGGFIRSVAPLLKPGFHTLTTAQQEAFVSSLQFIVRKGAHFSIYALLGALLSVGVFTYRNVKNLTKSAISFAVAAVYAVSDEIHQSFVSGRSCELRDMMIDWSGALLGCLIVLLLYLWINKKRTCRN